MAEPIDFTTLKQHAPYAQHQTVDVTFGEAYTDIEVRHTLQPPTPEHVDYTILRQAQAGTVYHDMTGTRKPWRDGVLLLRSNVANARVTLLLTVSHKKRELIETTPAVVIPATADHEHDAADVTSGEFDAALIPDLDAAIITSGTFADARIPNLAASKITSGALDKARQHAQTAYKDEANTFAQEQIIDESTSDINAYMLQLKNTNTGANARALINFDNDGSGITNGIVGVTGANYSAGTFLNDQMILNAGSTLANGMMIHGVGGLHLAFPATQLASSDANTLDDYEEGTFTPVLAFGGGSTGITYSYRYGWYTKIGNLVSLEISVILTAKGSSTGVATIGGCPFNAAGAPVGVGDYPAGAAASVTGMVFTVMSGSTAYVCQSNTPGGIRLLLTDADFTNTSDIRINITFRV